VVGCVCHPVRFLAVEYAGRSGAVIGGDGATLTSTLRTMTVPSRIVVLDREVTLTMLRFVHEVLQSSAVTYNDVVSTAVYLRVNHSSTWWGAF